MDEMLRTMALPLSCDMTWECATPGKSFNTHRIYGQFNLCHSGVKRSNAHHIWQEVILDHAVFPLHNSEVQTVTWLSGVERSYVTVKWGLRQDAGLFCPLGLGGELHSPQVVGGSRIWQGNGQNRWQKSEPWHFLRKMCHASHASAN